MKKQLLVLLSLLSLWPVLRWLGQRPGTSIGGAKQPAGGAWVEISLPDNISVFVYSAFFDLRNESDGYADVRLIGVTDIRLDQAGIRCVITCAANPDGDSSSDGFWQVVPVRMDPAGFGSRWGESFYREYVFSCGRVLASVVHCSRPLAHLVPAEGAAEPTVGGFWRSTVGAVIEMPETRIDKRNFLICVPASFGDIVPGRLAEWLRYQRIMNIDHVAIYDHSLGLRASRVLRGYRRSGFVLLQSARHFPTRDGGRPLPVALQWSPTINDCLYRNGLRFRWIIVIDLDEILVPRRHADVWSMLNFLRQRYNTSFDEYIFRNAYFFTDLPCDRSRSGGTVFTRCRQRLPVSRVGYAVKSIINPLSCVVMHHHYCWLALNEARFPVLDVPYQYGLLHHYKPCHLDQFLLDGEPSVCDQIRRDPERYTVPDDTMLRFEGRLRHLGLDT